MSRHHGPTTKRPTPDDAIQGQIRDVYGRLQDQRAKAAAVNHARGFRAPIVWPDPRLTEPAAEVHAADITALQALAERPGQALLPDSTQALLECLDCLAFTARALNAGGLAAPQIGVPLRVCVVRGRAESTPDAPAAAAATADAEPADVLIELINPEIVERSGSVWSEEGCLSLPGERIAVERSTTVLVRGIDRAGQPIEVCGETMPGDALATVLQHEIEHLDGILLVHHLSALRRGRIRDDLAKRKRAGLHWECPAPSAATHPPRAATPAPPPPAPAPALPPPAAVLP